MSFTDVSLSFLAPCSSTSLPKFTKSRKIRGSKTGHGDVDQEALPGKKVRYLLFSERYKLMDSLLAPFQTFKARATSLWLCVFIVWGHLCLTIKMTSVLLLLQCMLWCIYQRTRTIRLDLAVFQIYLFVS